MSCCYLVAQSCLTLSDPMDCSLPGPSVHGNSQARILEWVTNCFSRGFPWPKDWPCVSFVGKWILCLWATTSTVVQVCEIRWDIFLHRCVCVCRHTHISSRMLWIPCNGFSSLEAVTFQMVCDAVWIPTKVACLPDSIYTIDFCRVNRNSLLTFHYAEHRTNRKTSLRSDHK